MWERFKEEIKSPLAVSGWLLGLFSTVWGVYSWIVPNQFSEISYLAEQRESDCGFRLEDIIRWSGYVRGYEIAKNIPKGIKYSGHVCVTKISVWNSGNLDISHDQIQRDVRILFEDRSDIFYSLLSFPEESKNDAGFRIKQNGDFISIDWKIFEPNTGFSVEILHSNHIKENSIHQKFREPNYGQGLSLESSAIVSGKVVGVSKFVNSKEGPSLRKFILFTEKHDNIIVFTLILFSVLLISIYYRNKHKDSEELELLVSFFGKIALLLLYFFVTQIRTDVFIKNTRYPPPEIFHYRYYDD